MYLLSEVGDWADWLESAGDVLPEVNAAADSDDIRRPFDEPLANV